MKTPDYIFKYFIIGDFGVGKSNLLTRFTENTYSEYKISKIVLDIKIKQLEIDNKIINLKIWDTAGQERFKYIESLYYKNANGIILVYDISNLESFKSLNLWLIEIEKESPKNVYKILVGNKCDLKNRKISFDEGKKFAKDNNMKFFEISVKESINVNDVFICMTKDIIKNGCKYKNEEKNIVISE